ncbi:MAG: vWA domain-containing protein [Polyangiales bacterium]
MKLSQWLTLVGVGIAGAVVLACGSDEGTLSSGQARDSDGDAQGDESPDAGKGGSSSTTRRDGGRGGSTSSGGGGTSSDNTCDALTVQARPNSPEILIVLDRSGSMVGLGGTAGIGRNRWQGSMSAVQKVTEQLTETVAFGLMTFPARSGGIGGFPIGGIGGAGNTCQAGKVDVPVGLNSAAMIATTLRGATPDFGATPTAATLEAARGALNGNASCVDCVEAPKYVLLVTDGQPTCGATGSAETTPEDIAATTSAIDKLREDGVKTYVVGFDTVNDATVAATMNQFAQHGGTERHFPVENEATLVNELVRIASALVPCEYELASDVDDPDFVRVTIDGEQQNLSDGAWRIEGNKIILEGSCEKLKDAKAHDLRIVRECELVNVI